MVNLKKKRITARQGRKISNETAFSPGVEFNKRPLLSWYPGVHWYEQPFILLGFILGLTALVYSNAFHQVFMTTWDDNVYITENKDIRHLGIENLKAFFTKFYCGNYQPLTILSYAVEYAFAGDKSALLYHVDNVILHLVNVFLAFLIFWHFSRKMWTGAIVALFYGIHPTHIESVTWVAERKDVLYSSFFLLSMLMYYYYLQREIEIKGKAGGGEKAGSGGSRKYYLLALLFTVLSLLSKSAAVIFPVVMLLMDYLFKRKLSVRLILEKIPFFILAVLFGIIAMKSQTGAIHDEPFYSFFQKILVINHTLLRYLFMAVIPTGLAAYHPYPPLIDTQPIPELYYFSPVFTLLIIALVLLGLRKSRIPAFGLMFFLATIALVIQAVPVGSAIMADRYTYIPYLGVFYVIADFIVRLWEKKSSFQYLSRTLVIILISAGTIGFSITTYSRNFLWKDSEKLWTDVCNQYPYTAFIGFLKRGVTRADRKNFTGAYEDFNQALRIKDDLDGALFARGRIRLDSGNVAGALRDFDRLLSLKPKNFLNEYYNIRGDARRQANDFKGSLEDLNKALEVQADFYPALNNRGRTKAAMGNMKEALEDYSYAIKVNPNGYEALDNRGILKGQINDMRGALEDLNKSLEIKPDYEDALNNRGILKAMMKDQTGALNDFNLAIRNNPKAAKALINRAILMLEQKNDSAAMHDFEQTISADPRYTLAYVYLGRVKFDRGDRQGACQEWYKGAQFGDKTCIMNIERNCR